MQSDDGVLPDVCGEVLVDGECPLHPRLLEVPKTKPGKAATR